MFAELTNYNVAIPVTFTLFVINTCVETFISQPPLYYARGDRALDI